MFFLVSCTLICWTSWTMKRSFIIFFLEPNKSALQNRCNANPVTVLHAFHGPRCQTAWARRPGSGVVRPGHTRYWVVVRHASSFAGCSFVLPKPERASLASSQIHWMGQSTASNLIYSRTNTRTYVDESPPDYLQLDTGLPLPFRKRYGASGLRALYGPIHWIWKRLLM